MELDQKHSSFLTCARIRMKLIVKLEKYYMKNKTVTMIFNKLNIGTVPVVRKLRESENRPDQLAMRIAYRLPPLLRTDVRKQ